MRILIMLGGVFNLICGISHIFYPKYFKWNYLLAALDPDKKKTIKQSLYLSNHSMFLFWMAFSVIPIFFSAELLSTKLGMTVLTSIVIFWTLRIFVIQLIVVGFRTRGSIVRSGFFLIGFALFLIPWLNVILKH